MFRELVKRASLAIYSFLAECFVKLKTELIPSWARSPTSYGRAVCKFLLTVLEKKKKKKKAD